MEIFANHAHVFPKSFREEGCVDALLRVMDETGIAKAVCFAPFPSFNSCENPNKWLAEEIKPHSNLYGFGVVDMCAENLGEQVDEIFSLGFSGIKMHPQFQKFRIDGEKAKLVYKKAQDLGLFITFHSGIHWNRLADSEVKLFDEVAHFFPNLVFSLEHVGGYCFFNDALAVILNNKNVYAGLTSVFDNEMNKLWFLNPEKISALLHLAGAGRCILGLDFPYNQTEKISQAIKSVMALDISEDEKIMIFSGNLKKHICRERS